MSHMNETAVILLHPEDTVVVCVRAVAAGEHVRFEGGELVAREVVATGHKLARHGGAAGDKVIKYGASIGSLIAPVEPGDWVHLHNMKSDYIDPHTRAGLAHGAA
jgi:hypothetical protein